MQSAVLEIVNKAGEVLAQGKNVLLYDAAYQPGDAVVLTVPQTGYYARRAASGC